MDIKIILNITAIMTIACLCISCGGSDPSERTVEMEINESWQWENPYSFVSITIPARWQEANAEQMQEAMLSVQHSSGRSLVYIMNEESLENLSLEEYLDAVKPQIITELGIDDFDIIEDPEIGQYAEANGAKYMGNTLAGTYIRLWLGDDREFWRTASITNMEYKSLEYEARELVETLMISSDP